MSERKSGQATALRVALVGEGCGDLIQAAGLLAPAIAAMRHKVLAFVPDLDDSARSALQGISAQGAAYVSPSAGGLLGEQRSINALAKAFTDFHPNVVVGFGLQAMAIAGMAARRAKAQRCVAVASSLGALATKPDARPGLRMRWLLRRALKSADAIVFYNRDDAARLTAAGVLPGVLDLHVVAGAGVDLVHETVLQLPPLGDGVVFTTIAPLTTSGGAVDFCEAARRVRTKARNARFVLVRDDIAPGQALAAGKLGGYADCVEFRDVVDCRADLAACHVYVQPWVGTGMPSRLLSALAAGRPLITTDAPGCRDTVDERVNGVLVPPGDPVALATAMEGFLKRPDLVPWMARASRLKAERRFDATAVNAEMLGILGLARA